MSEEKGFAVHGGLPLGLHGEKREEAAVAAGDIEAAVGAVDGAGR